MPDVSTFFSLTSVSVHMNECYSLFAAIYTPLMTHRSGTDVDVTEGQDLKQQIA